MDRVRPDYTVPIGMEGHDEPLLMNPRYDAIHGFKWIGHAILRVVGSEGMAHVHLDYETAERVSEATDIPITEFEFITDRDYECYLQTQQDRLDDSWLGE
jgi:hypothetical protein